MWRPFLVIKLATDFTMFTPRLERHEKQSLEGVVKIGLLKARINYAVFSLRPGFGYSRATAYHE